MKSEKRKLILEYIKESARTIDDLFYIFCLPYGTSYSKMHQLLGKRDHKKILKVSNQQKQKAKIRFNDFVYHLKKDNLIYNTNRNNNKSFQLTLKGERALEEFNSYKTKWPSYSGYESEKDKTLKILIFDIPEKERRKRDWLRCALKNMKFEMLQKSVWAGKRGLPKEFIDDLKRMNIFSFVEIFAVTKTGSLIQYSG
jgi:predicted transcriptional regulator